jgi:hypothetical protein
VPNWPNELCFATVQAANSDYASFAIEEDRVFFDLFHFARANSQTRIPGYFPMLGGPAFGPNALVKIIKHYGWQRCATSGFVQSSTMSCKRRPFATRTE